MSFYIKLTDIAAVDTLLASYNKKKFLMSFYDFCTFNQKYFFKSCQRYFFHIEGNKLGVYSCQFKYIFFLYISSKVRPVTTPLEASNST